MTWLSSVTQNTCLIAFLELQGVKFEAWAVHARRHVRSHVRMSTRVTKAIARRKDRPCQHYCQPCYRTCHMPTSVHHVSLAFYEATVLRTLILSNMMLLVLNLQKYPWLASQILGSCIAHAAPNRSELSLM